MTGIVDHYRTKYNNRKILTFTWRIREKFPDPFGQYVGFKIRQQ